MKPQDEDTEWNDILRQKGILPPKPPSQKELIEKALDEAVEAHHLKKESQYEECDLAELDELEDDLDERIILEYRNKRLAELQAQLKKEKFGSVIQISKPDFIREVTEASNEAPVVVHLFKDSVLACRQLNAFLDDLAVRYKATKFVKIIGDLCIENYPDRNLPTLLLYKQELEKLLHSYEMIGKSNTRSRDDGSPREATKNIRSKDLSD
ncbi:Proteolipid protein 2, partial [Massospora cicadina]